MSDPSWGQGNIYEAPGNFTFPSPQEFTNNVGATASQITAPAPPAASTWNYVEFKCINSTTQGFCCGFVQNTYSGPNIRNNVGQAGCCWVAENGAVFSNGGSVGSASTPNVTGQSLAFLINETTGQFGVSTDGVNWNGSHTAANIISGANAYTLGFSGTLWPFVSLNNADMSWAIYASAANCAYALPTGASYLPANTFLVINAAFSFPGVPVNIEWTAQNGSISAGLKYSLNGAAFAACTGVTTGPSGTALGPTIAQAGQYTLVLQDSSFANDQSALFSFAVVPAGAGRVLANYSGMQNAGSPGAQTLTLAGGPYNKVLYAVSYDYISGVTATGDMNVFDINNVEVSVLTFGELGHDPVTGSVFAGNGAFASSPPPVSGPGSVTITGNYIAISGVLDAGLGFGTSAEGTATVSMDGTISQYGTTGSLVDWSGTQADPFYNLIFDPESLFGTLDVTVTFYAAETLTITGASYPYNGTLTVVGSVNNATLTALKLSTNGGSTFAASNSITVSGNATFATWSATLNTMLSTGTYPLQAQDETSGCLSNIYDFTLGPPDKLYVSQAVEQVLLAIPDQLLVSQAVEQVLLSLPQFNRVGLFQTDVVPNAESTYVEFGENLSWNYETSLLPDNQEVSSNGMIVTTLGMAFVGSSPVVAVQATDADGNLITQAAIVSGGTDSLWDEATWDVDVWDGTPSPISPWQIPWPVAVVFRQMQVGASGYSVAGFRVGNLYMQYQQLGYVAQLPSGAR